MDSLILTEKIEGVLYLTLNRPEVYNSFNREMALEMQKLLDQAAIDDEIRCVAITGAGKAFSAGQDLKEVTDPAGPPINRIVGEHYNPIIARIRELKKPVVALVNGVAAGAGANIALACDIAIAVQTASFLQAFSKIGLIPDSGGTYTLPRLVGWQRASALMMLGEKVSATDAERMGMIYKAIPTDEFEHFGKELCKRLAKLPTRGLALTKMALNKSAVNDFHQQLALEEQYQLEAGSTEDYREGVAAFLEKRTPEFKGK